MTTQHESRPRAVRTSPGESIQRQPWAFAGLALAAGLLTGLALRVTSVRKALKVYGVVRRFI